MIKVLYIAGTGPFGGASRSLYEAVRAMPEGAVNAHFVAARGTALNFYRKVAKDTISTWGISRFDHSWIGHYRGMRWLILLREAARIPFTVSALLRARLRWSRVDVIHVNEFLELGAGLLAKALFKAPLVLHARSLAMVDRRMWRTRAMHDLLRRYVDVVIAIDETVRATFPVDLPVVVVHNSFDVDQTVERDERLHARLAQLRPTSLKIGFVGNLLRYKGLAELVRAAALGRHAGRDIQYLIIGGAFAPETGLHRKLLKRLGLANNMRVDLEEFVAAEELEDDFLVLGPSNDLNTAYSAMDVLAFPSHLNAAGRPVFEAAFHGVPSIVAVREPLADTIVDGETGIVIDKPEPALIMDAIAYFADHPKEIERMGGNARALAERNFSPAANAAALLNVYDTVLRGTRRKARLRWQKRPEGVS